MILHSPKFDKYLGCVWEFDVLVAVVVESWSVGWEVISNCVEFVFIVNSGVELFHWSVIKNCVVFDVGLGVLLCWGFCWMLFGFVSLYDIALLLRFFVEVDVAVVDLLF